MHVLARLLLALAVCAASPAAASQADPAAPADRPDTLRVLMVGNSLTYANNLPRLVQAIAASQPGGPRIETATYALPGADLSALWKDGHAAAALRQGDWDVLVLQERGGLLTCMASNRLFPECRRSIDAHREFTRLAQATGTRVLLFSTWGRITDRTLNDRTTRQRHAEILHNAYASLARQLASGGARVEILPAASWLLAPTGGDYDPAPFTDNVHPSASSSLVIAAGLVAAITGHVPAPHDVEIDFPLLPPAARVEGDAPLETQPQLAGDGTRIRLAAQALSPLYVRLGGG
jgi:hypothetical protein